MWIKRDISKIIEANNDVIQILRGPRQCGKTSLVLNLDSNFQEVSLDDPHLRDLAQKDPELFLKQFNHKKLFIDEAQYAPNLFPSLKRRADLFKRELKNPPETIVRLTGSNQIMMDKNIKESLAGRATFFNLSTLSVAEILAAKKMPVQNIIYQGGWPELYATDNKNTKNFMDSYINSYIEKDIVLSAGIQKAREFLQFAKLLAGRVGELLDYASLAKDIGVDAKTVKDWVSVLERMHIIALVEPYSTNLSKRLIKSPKVYFLDTGLACRLQGWTSPEPIITSPQQGHLFENLVFCEIYKTILNFNLDWTIYHWRSREGEEIDFLIKISPYDFIFLEAKTSAQTLPNVTDYPQVKKIFKDKAPKVFLCHQEGEHTLGQNIPIAFLKHELLSLRH